MTFSDKDLVSSGSYELSDLTAEQQDLLLCKTPQELKGRFEDYLERFDSIDLRTFLKEQFGYDFYLQKMDDSFGEPGCLLKEIYHFVEGIQKVFPNWSFADLSLKRLDDGKESENAYKEAIVAGLGYGEVSPRDLSLGQKVFYGNEVWKVPNLPNKVYDSVFGFKPMELLRAICVNSRSSYAETYLNSMLEHDWVAIRSLMVVLKKNISSSEILHSYYQDGMKYKLDLTLLVFRRLFDLSLSEYGINLNEGEHNDRVIFL